MVRIPVASHAISGPLGSAWILSEEKKISTFNIREFHKLKAKRHTQSRLSGNARFPVFGFLALVATAVATPELFSESTISSSGNVSAAKLIKAFALDCLWMSFQLLPPVFNDKFLNVVDRPQTSLLNDTAEAAFFFELSLVLVVSENASAEMQAMDFVTLSLYHFLRVHVGKSLWTETVTNVALRGSSLFHSTSIR